MNPTKDVSEKAGHIIEAIGKVYEKLPSAEDLMQLIENKETELRLKFESLTLDGDIALSITLLKQEKGKE
ncbi:MAG: hypothetical protein JSW28_05440 [Thermoplasmata archaeon]|nr:MAG: hypothetical protein JSW28_05440 [Thermoplasmata archaeon]